MSAILLAAMIDLHVGSALSAIVDLRVACTLIASNYRVARLSGLHQLGCVLLFYLRPMAPVDEMFPMVCMYACHQ